MNDLQRPATLWFALLVVALMVTGSARIVLADTDSPQGEERVLLTPNSCPEPQINGPKVFGVRPGRPFIYRIPATGDRPMLFAAEALPEGLKLDPKTGIITGMVPQARGDYGVTLRATNALGTSE